MVMVANDTDGPAYHCVGGKSKYNGILQVLRTRNERFLDRSTHSCPVDHLFERRILAGRGFVYLLLKLYYL